MRKRSPNTLRAMRYSGPAMDPISFTWRGQVRSGAKSASFFSMADTLLWLNETPCALGSYWHFAQNGNQRYIPQNNALLTSKANRR